MVLRAEEGECVEVKLFNELPETMSQHDDHALVPVNEEDFENSNRISLHPTGLVKYSTQHSDGMTVGWNFDQTVGPGDNITYRWFANEEVGTVTLMGGADIRNHRHHGAYGTLIVEPSGSTWLDPVTGEEIETGTRAVIVPENGEAFREYALQPTDGHYVVNPDGTCPVPPEPDDNSNAPCNQVHGDPEDQGFKTLNYRAEPLPRRLEDDSREHLFFSSKVHGDPATPVLHANVGDKIVFRVSQPADKARGVTFQVAGHVFPYQSEDQGSGSS